MQRIHLTRIKMIASQHQVLIMAHRSDSVTL